MNNLKLGVEVISAHNLISKDGEGSSSAYVELRFDEQRFRTTTKEKDLNPFWNETFYFNISDPNSLSNLGLDAFVYNYDQANNSKSLLGKVSLSGTSFVAYSEACALQYPLEKRGYFSRVKGELSLKVFIVDDPSIMSSNPLPAMDAFLQAGSILQGNNQAQTFAEQVQNIVSNNPASNKKGGTRHTFRHLPNSSLQKEQTQPPSQQTMQQSVRFDANPMMKTPTTSKFVGMFPGSSSQQPPDYSLKETSPFLGGGQIIGGRVMKTDKPLGTYDLVEQMQYLFVRVVKARELPTSDKTGSLDPYVDVKLGNYKGTTKHFEKTKTPQWNQVFVFSKDRMQASVLDVVVMDKDLIKDDFIGMVRFDLNEIPTRLPPDSPLAPEWYRLADAQGVKSSSTEGELMLAVWNGTQADEAFSDAWNSDAVDAVDSSSSTQIHMRSKVYHSPRLWYVRVHIIEAQDLIISDRGRIPNVQVKVQIGSKIDSTKPVQVQNMNPLWNEEFMFVAAEPFDDHLVFTVVDHVAPGKFESLGRVFISLASVEKRADDRDIQSRWYNFDKSHTTDGDQVTKKDRHSSKLHIRVFLDGGYHVFDESTHYSSDLRPTARQLWKKSIGVLELGILSADKLQPFKPRQGKVTLDTFCVAKYGQKWVRTRTVINSLNPKYNEQYTWEVYDPATVITLGVFDNGQICEKGQSSNNDTNIGKIRIRISTLETGRVYTHAYPLLLLKSSGVKKSGELHLAIRFTCTSRMNLMMMYKKPLLPKMHYAKPISMPQREGLRVQAIKIVAARLGRAEPPLRKEVVDCLSDVNGNLWSMRKSKANFYRIVSVFSSVSAVANWFVEVCKWKNRITTVLVHALLLMLVCFPELVLPTMFIYMFLIGLWRYPFRPRNPQYMNTQISFAEAVTPDELDEEFDDFPTTKNPELVRNRYDRLRSVAGRIQTVVGDVASQMERLESLLSWRDPRATAIFMVFCIVAAIVLYTTPFKVLMLVAVFYQMRHPRFRHKLPSPPINFFRRLAARADSMI